MHDVKNLQLVSLDLSNCKCFLLRIIEVKKSFVQKKAHIAI